MLCYMLKQGVCLALIVFTVSEKLTPINQPFAAYPGSTIQQNYGESIDNHGYLLWDLGSKQVTPIDITNDHTYHTIRVEAGTDYDDLDIKLTPSRFTHIKVQWVDYLSQLTKENKAKVTRHLRERYKPVELHFRQTALKVNNHGHISELSAERLVNIGLESNQTDIFREYLSTQQFSEEDIQAILKIHSSVSERLRQSGYQDSQGSECKLQTLIIDNFKSYGDRVTLNWDGLDGVWQITGENTAGKSTILDAITYLLYGTMLGAMTAEKFGENRFINNIRDLDYCEVTGYMTINGVQHKLVRRTDRTWQNSKGVRTMKTVSTSVNLFEVLGQDGDGKEALKDVGVDRKVQTDKLLGEYFGTIQDFMRTSFINADTLTGLLSINHSVFVDSLLRDIGLDIFERLLKEFKTWRDETYNKVSKIILNPSETEQAIIDYTNNIQSLEEESKEIDGEIKHLDERILKGSKYRDELLTKIQPLRNELKDADPEALREEIHGLLARQEQLKSEMSLEQARLDALVTTYTQEAYDSLLLKKESFQEAVNGFRGKLREQDIIMNDAKHQVALIQGRMNLRERDIQNLHTNAGRQKVLDEKEIAMAEAELSQLENSKTCPTCKRLKNEEAITAIQEVISGKMEHLEALKLALSAYPERLKVAEDKIRLDIIEIESEKAPYLAEIQKCENAVAAIKAEQEGSILGVDEVSQEIATMVGERQVWEKKQKRTQDMLMVPMRIENIELQKEAKVRLLGELEQAQAIVAANEVIQGQIHRTDSALTALRFEHDGLERQRTVLDNSAIPQLVQKIKYLKEQLVKYAEQEHRDHLLRSYEKCIHRDGIPTMLLKQYLSVINIQIANLLDSMKFTLFLNDQLQFKMFNNERDEAVMNALQGSGMQKTFASLVLRLALRQVNNKFRNNMLLMDEILGKLDVNYLERFSELLSRAKEQIDKLVIIEHGYGDTISADYIIQVTADKRGVSSLTY